MKIITHFDQTNKVYIGDLRIYFISIAFFLIREEQWGNLSHYKSNFAKFVIAESQMGN